MTNPPFNLLVIADELRVLRFLRAALAHHEYRLEEATTGADGLLKAAMHKHDLVLIDLDLPHIDRLEITHQLHIWTHTPLIALSIRGQEEDKIAVLDAGADDYLAKPFGMGELLARVRAARSRTIRTANATKNLVFHVGDLRMEPAQRMVWVGERRIHLTPIEYKLLTILVQHAGVVLTHGQLLSTVWGPDYAQAKHYLRVYMGMLRRKQKKIQPARAICIQNRRLATG